MGFLKKVWLGREVFDSEYGWGTVIYETENCILVQLKDNSKADFVTLLKESV